jgi:hypothetical protein
MLLSQPTWNSVMTVSTAKFLILHLMSALMGFGCVLVAQRMPRFYLPAGAFFIVALATLNDFIHYHLLDLRRC